MVLMKRLMNDLANATDDANPDEVAGQSELMGYGRCGALKMRYKASGSVKGLPRALPGRSNADITAALCCGKRAAHTTTVLENMETLGRAGPVVAGGAASGYPDPVSVLWLCCNHYEAVNPGVVCDRTHCIYC